MARVFPYFAQYAPRMVDNGYSVVAMLPGTKRPRFERWQGACRNDTDEGWLTKHVKRHPADSIGLACGQKIIAIDIDIDDPALAHEIDSITRTALGDTPLLRVGRWPRRALLYQAAEAIPTRKGPSVELLANPAVLVSFGIHQETGKPYYWPDGDPCDTPLDRVPAVARHAAQRAFENICNLVRGSRAHVGAMPGNSRSWHSVGQLSTEIVRDSNGIVVDGREAFLTMIVWHEYHKGFATPSELAARCHARFALEAELVRPKGGHGVRRWAFRDTLTKVKAICRKRPNRPLIAARGEARPASHLHSHRRPGYWGDDQKAAHQYEAVRCARTPAELIVNRKMLAAVPLQAGQCTATVLALVEQTGLSKSAVKTARRELIKAGLWIAEDGVYVPVPIGEAEEQPSNCPACSGGEDIHTNQLAAA